jgi:hypothetical protein
MISPRKGVFSFTLVLDAGAIRNPAALPRIFSWRILMIYLLDRLAREESEADREQFVRGVLGLDKFHASSMVAGWIAGSLTAKTIARRK